MKSIEQLKKSVIAQIKRKGGLFENCGQKELRILQDQAMQNSCSFSWDDKCQEFDDWLQQLEYGTIKI